MIQIQNQPLQNCDLKPKHYSIFCLLDLVQIVLDPAISVGSVSKSGPLTVAPFTSENSFLRSEPGFIRGKSLISRDRIPSHTLAIPKLYGDVQKISEHATHD
jgi:hypothetical protein